MQGLEKALFGAWKFWTTCAELAETVIECLTRPTNVSIKRANAPSEADLDFSLARRILSFCKGRHARWPATVCYIR